MGGNEFNPSQSLDGVEWNLALYGLVAASCAQRPSIHVDVAKVHRRTSWVALVSTTALREFNRVSRRYEFHFSLPSFMYMWTRVHQGKRGFRSREGYGQQQLCERHIMINDLITVSCCF